MIKPTMIYELFRQCDDSKWLGDICRALGGQEVTLDFGQRMQYNTIACEIKRYEESVEQERERKKAYMRKKRAKSARGESPTEQPPRGESSTEQGGENTEQGGENTEQPSQNENSTEQLSRDETACHVARVPCIHTDIHTAIHTNKHTAIQTNECDINAREKFAPTKEQVMIVARNNGIDLEFAQAFFEDMECDKWRFINNSGTTVCVTPNNVAIVLRGRWRNLKARKVKAKKSVTNQPESVNYQEEGYDYSKLGD